MAEQRKFFKTVIHVTVLSEDVPLEYDDLTDVHRAISEDDCVGKVEHISVEQVTGEECVALLLDAGSEPAFFRLDDAGNDTAGEDES